MSNVSGVQQARDRVLQMARQIEDLSQSTAPPDSFFPEFLRLLVGSMGGRAGAIWMVEAGRLALAHELRFSETGIRENPRAASLNDKLLGETLSTGQAAFYAADDPGTASKVPGNFLVIVAALQIGEDSVGAVEIFQRPDAPREARSGFLQFVEQMAGHASRYLERRQSHDGSDDSVRFLGDFEQFLLQIQRAQNVEEAAVTAANDGRQLLGCDRLSVALHKGKKTSIVAISGQDRVNARANLTRAMKDIASQVVSLGEPLTYNGRVDHLPKPLEEPLARFIQESGSRMVKLVPLLEPEPLIPIDNDKRPGKSPRRKEPIGCLVIEQTAESRLRPRVESRAEMLGEHVAAVLAHARRRERVLFLPLLETLGRGREWFHGRRLAKTLVAVGGVGLIIAALCIVPWDYRISAKGKLMPIRRQQVFAPENGDVRKLHVKGGDEVREGQPLLDLHNEQLLAELNENESKLRQSIQQVQAFNAESAAAKGEADRQAELRAVASRKKAQLEVEGLTRIVKILGDRVNSLEIKSPLAGTVSTFDIEQLLQNRPVQQGELLLEVMDKTGPWRLELEVEGSRIGHLLRAYEASPNHELPVEFIPATAAESTFAGTLNRVATRSALSSDQSNIFEVYVATDAKKIPDLQIGAEVRAKINCGKRSLGYVLFGDVIEFLRQRLWL